MSAPRLVIVHRATQLAGLLAEHSTLGNVEFFLSTRGQTVAPLVEADEAQRRALDETAAAVPTDWRLAMVEREHLSRFLFEPDDLVAVVGQDGLVPNVSKYLDAQLVLGITPGAAGLMCRHSPADLRALLAGASSRVERRATVEAVSDDGQRLRALNEVFVGDRGHQSARYELAVGDEAETQSSSGLIVGTGTGATGWLASLWRQSRPGFFLPEATSNDLAYFVREAWPSPATGTSLTSGLLGPEAKVRLTARSALVVFGDGIERDCLKLDWGQSITLAASPTPLRLAFLQRRARAGA